MFKPDWKALEAAMARKGHAFFKTGRLNLNLIGVRHSDYASNGFDDVLCCAYMDPEGKRIVEHWPATTDPGWHWLREEFMNSKGCAVLVPGQYRGAFAEGLHKVTATWLWARMTNVLLCFLCVCRLVPGFEGVAACVAEDFRFDDEHAGESGFDDVHSSISLSRYCPYSVLSMSFTLSRMSSFVIQPFS